MSKILEYSLLGTGVLLVVAGLATPRSNGSNNGGGNGNGGTTTFTPAQFASMSNELVNAKSYVDDDEDTFYRIFEGLQTPGDLAQLIYVFGEKSWGVWPMQKNMNLVDWVKHTLSPNEQKRVKAVFDKFNHPF